MPDKAESEALASYWLQQIEAWQSSGQTQQSYCKNNELSYHRFGYWRRKFRQQSQEAQSQKGFVPVIYTMYCNTSRRRIRWERLKLCCPGT